MYAAIGRDSGKPTITNEEHTKLTWLPFDEAAALTDLALDDY